MCRIITFEFVQNNNNARSGFTLLKRSGMVSNLLKRWRDDFATVKRQRDGFGGFRKETGCHPASPQALLISVRRTVFEIENSINYWLVLVPVEW
jgi:hypothetical protein